MPDTAALWLNIAAFATIVALVVLCGLILKRSRSKFARNTEVAVTAYYEELLSAWSSSPTDVDWRRAVFGAKTVIRMSDYVSSARSLRALGRAQAIKHVAASRELRAAIKGGSIEGSEHNVA